MNRLPVAPIGQALIFSLLLTPALAQAAAAQILFSLNRVEIQRGQVTLPAIRGTAVETGDTITTGPTGYTQVRYKDGALMALKPGTSLQIEEYVLPAALPAAVAPVTAAAPRPIATPISTNLTGGRSVLRLLRGAFRTITGAIGKNASDVYRVVTPTATIGIRGTDYSASYCDSNCGKGGAGLFVGVSNGQIVVSNGGGELVLYDNQYATVTDANTAPEQVLAPPESLETPIESSEKEDEQDDSAGDAPATTESSGGGEEAASPPAEDTQSPSTIASSDNTPVEQKSPESEFELQPGEPGLFAFSLAPLQSATRFVGGGFDGVYTDADGNVIGLLALDTRGLTLYSIGNSQNDPKDLGADPDTGLRWGRWTPGGATVAGQAFDPNTSLHWIYSASGDRPVLPTTGTFSYSLTGNTRPTDTLGNIGSLDAASLSANFDNQTVSSELFIGINSQVWHATSTSGSLISGSPIFAGGYNVNINNAIGTQIGAGAGDFAGFFTNNAAGAGLSYSLESSGLSTNTTVSGAAAFGNPAPAGAGP